jgi:hypothetical protein
VRRRKDACCCSCAWAHSCSCSPCSGQLVRGAPIDSVSMGSLLLSPCRSNMLTSVRAG